MALILRNRIILLLCLICFSIGVESKSRRNRRRRRRRTLNVDLCPDTFWVENKDGESAGVPYCTSHPLGEYNRNITRAVVVMHGRSYNPKLYFDNMVEAVNLHQARGNTLIIAPQIVRRKYLKDLDLDKDEYLGFNSMWVYGTNIATPFLYSSFDFMDDLLDELDDEDIFPSLSQVVLAGHSAGGQFVQRYAVASKFEPHIYELTYFLANPSSYLYLSKQRFFTGKKYCSRYDHWGYGLSGLYAYPQAIGKRQMRKQYQERNVVYAVGELDNERDRVLTDTCGAELMGSTRYERARFFFQHLQEFYEEPTHKLIVVPQAGHNHREIFSNPMIRKILFGSITSIY